MKKVVKVSIIKGSDDCPCQECDGVTYWKCPVCETPNHIDRQHWSKDRFYKPQRVKCTNCSEKFGVKSIRDRKIERLIAEDEALIAEREK